MNYDQVQFRMNALIKARREHRLYNPTWGPVEEAICGARIALAFKQMRRLTKARYGSRPGLVGGKGPRQCSPVPMPPPEQRLNVTIPGMPSPALALAQREEEPFPLCKVRRLPGVPRTPTPANGTPRPVPRPSPQHDPDSLFTRALAWTLKSRRA